MDLNTHISLSIAFYTSLMLKHTPIIADVCVLPKNTLVSALVML